MKHTDNIFTDDVLNALPSNRNINIGVANKINASDPSYIKNQQVAQARVLNDPEKVRIRKEAARRGGDTKANSEEYQKLMTEVNRKKAQSPDFAIKNSLGIKKKWEDPEYQAKQLAKALSQGTPVIGPDGKTYLTTRLASDETGISIRCIRIYSKNNLHGWKRKENV